MEGRLHPRERLPQGGRAPRPRSFERQLASPRRPRAPAFRRVRPGKHALAGVAPSAHALGSPRAGAHLGSPLQAPPLQQQQFQQHSQQQYQQQQPQLPPQLLPQFAAAPPPWGLMPGMPSGPPLYPHLVQQQQQQLPLGFTPGYAPPGLFAPPFSAGAHLAPPALPPQLGSPTGGLPPGVFPQRGVQSPQQQQAQQAQQQAQLVQQAQGLLQPPPFAWPGAEPGQQQQR